MDSVLTCPQMRLLLGSTDVSWIKGKTNSAHSYETTSWFLSRPPPAGEQSHFIRTDLFFNFPSVRTSLWTGDEG